jgi:D-3-phosphoglycerate dehydrogenase / 2-oxoglutarate reductase
MLLGSGRRARWPGKAGTILPRSVAARLLQKPIRSTAIAGQPLVELLHAADLVTLHVNLCEATRRFFGQEQFATMKEGAWFVNTSRVELIDGRPLLGVLRSGRLAGAALDVLCEEHSQGMGGHPLVVYAREHDNLIITPHIA